MNVHSPHESRYYLRVTVILVLVIVSLELLSFLLSPILPPQFELLDFFSELSVFCFALSWTFIIRKITNPRNRLVISIGIFFFALGALADIIDEFGLSHSLRSYAENMSLLIGFFLVSIGIRDWIKVTWVEQTEMIQRNSYLANHDALTGLLNRQSLKSTAGELLRHHDRPGNRNFIGMIFIDLDNFKTVNDTMGHHIGDALLIDVANRIRKCIRVTDFFYRLGGDEFVVLATEISKEEDIYLIARKIQKSIREPFTLENFLVSTTGSIGIALHPRDGMTVDDLLTNADFAMYEAKKTRNTIHFFSQNLSDLALERATLEKALRHSIDRQEFYLCYQPIVDHTGKPIAYEALARWNHPEHRKVGPDRFISIAEETGMISELGRFLVSRAVTDLNEYFLPRDPSTSLSVNISMKQFEDQGFIDQMVDLFRQSECDASHLILEITESVFMSRIDEFIRTIQPLLDLGVRFAIDDFGSGYSSLSYFQKLPVEFVKFDKSMIDQENRNSNSNKILLGLVDITQSVGKSVIIEGIENRDALAMFRTNSDVYFQGYYFGRPETISIDDVYPVGSLTGA